MGQRGQVDPVIESPPEQSRVDISGSISSEDDLSSESVGPTNVMISSVQIVELPASVVAADISGSRVRSSTPIISTPDQPAPQRCSARIQADGIANMQVIRRAMEHVEARDKNIGNKSILTSNSFPVLDDREIVEKALEIGIDVSSMHLETVNMLKDLELARDNLSKQKRRLVLKLRMVLKLLLIMIRLVGTNNMW